MLFWTVVAAVAAVLALGVPFLLKWQPKRLLLYTMPEAASVLTSDATAVRSKLRVVDGNDVLDDPYTASFHMQIRSRRDIVDADFAKNQPLEFDFGVRVVALLSTSEALPLGKQGPRDVGTKILIGPTLIRKRANVRIDVLTDGKPKMVCRNPLVDVYEREVPILPNPRLSRLSRLPSWADVA
jgi:hypothetical protein